MKFLLCFQFKSAYSNFSHLLESFFFDFLKKMVYYIEILSFVGINMYIMFTFNFQILLYIYSYIPLLTANIFKNTE